MRGGKDVRRLQGFIQNGRPQIKPVFNQLQEPWRGRSINADSREAKPVRSAPYGAAAKPR